MTRTVDAIRPADNPFASRRIDAFTYRFIDGGLDHVLGRLDAGGGRGAIVGPHGSGKTTLLEALVPLIDSDPVWIRLGADTGRPAATASAALPGPIDRRHAVLIDGAEQLGAWSWLRLERRLRPAGVVIITSHRPGRLPTIHECTTNPELLADLVAELASDGTDDLDLEALFHRHDGNIRLCFRELYDVWAGRQGAANGIQ